MKVLVDIDGTLCQFKWFGKTLLNLYPFSNLVAYPNNNLKRIVSYIFSWLYSWMRIPDGKIIKEIRNLAQEGYTIFIFSAVPDIKRQRKAIEKWLRKNGVPFKGIFLMKRDETPIEFKLRVIKKIKPGIIYEDSYLLLEEISKTEKISEIFPPGTEIIIRIP